MGKERKAIIWPILISIVLALLAMLYACAYRALVEQDGVYADGGYRPGDELRANFRRYRKARYRMGGPAVGYFFWPAHQIDRQIRPNEWIE